MADITYNVIRKPIEERIIDAGCIYWEVGRGYFSKSAVKGDNTVVYRRRIIFYVIKCNTILSFKDIADKFGMSSHSQVFEGISAIEAQKNIYRQICEDINQITFLASKLDAEFVTTTVTLKNKNLPDGTIHDRSI